MVFFILPCISRHNSQYFSFAYSLCNPNCCAASGQLDICFELRHTHERCVCFDLGRNACCLGESRDRIEISCVSLAICSGAIFHLVD